MAELVKARELIKVLEQVIQLAVLSSLETTPETSMNITPPTAAQRQDITWPMAGLREAILIKHPTEPHTLISAKIDRFQDSYTFQYIYSFVLEMGDGERGELALTEKKKRTEIEILSDGTILHAEEGKFPEWKPPAPIQDDSENRELEPREALFLANYVARKVLEHLRDPRDGAAR